MEYLLASIVIGTLIIGLLILAYKVLSYVFSLLVPVARSAENIIISTITVVEEVSITLKDEADEWVKKEQEERLNTQNERNTTREEYKETKVRKAQRIRQNKLDAYEIKKAAKAAAKEAKETLDARVAAFKIKQAAKAQIIKSDLFDFETKISKATTVAEIASIIRRVSKSNVPLFTAYKTANPIYFSGKSLDVKAILANDDIPF